MPRYPLKYPETKDRFLIWSTIVDSPVIYDCTWEEVREEWKIQSGLIGIDNFDSRYPDPNKVDSIEKECEWNRAGEDESSLNLEQMLKAFPHSEND